MKIEQAITILKEHNKWRRGAPPYNEVGNGQPYSAKDIGLAIDCVVEELEGINGEQWEISPKFDADYLQSKIDAHTKYMQEHGLTTEQMLETLQEGRSDESIWHKASEELPKDDTHILYIKKTLYGLFYGIIYYPERPITDEMDWWMEIPELPKED